MIGKMKRTETKIEIESLVFLFQDEPSNTYYLFSLYQLLDAILYFRLDISVPSRLIETYHDYMRNF